MMSLFQRYMAFGLFVFGSGIDAYSNPEPCTGSCWAHDPALIQRASDGTYFRFNTDTYIDIKTADSLSGPWTDAGSVLPDGSEIILSGSTGLWAPAVINKDGSYHLYYSVSTLSSQTSVIGAATSNTLEQGSWTDHGSIGLTSDDGSAYNAIDPTVNEVDDTYYLTFGSYWGDIYQVTLGPKALAITETPTNQIQYQPANNHNAESASIYYYNGYYYLFWSEGQANRYATDMPASGGEYKVRACRSTAISGPYEDSSGTSCTDGGGEYVLESHGEVYGPGAQGVYDDPTYGTVMYYRYVNTTIGYAVEDYQWGWNVIDWSSGWPEI